MRRSLTLLFFGAFSVLAALDASLSYGRFLTKEGAYLEIYTHIAGSTVNWSAPNELDSLRQAAVHFTLVLRQAQTIFVADRFTLQSPKSLRMQDFVDLKRYALAAGTYQLEVALEDATDPNNSRRYSTSIELSNWPTHTAQSDILLLAKLDKSVEAGSPFERHGLLMEPLPYNFYGRGANTLAYYHEVYATDLQASDRVLLLTKIEVLKNGLASPVRAISKVQTTQALIPQVQQIDISSLPTGNYLLAVEVRSAENELICRKELPFQRANPLLDRQQREALFAEVDITKEFVGRLDYDSLRYSCLALLPLMPQQDVVPVSDMIKAKEVEGLRMYLLNYWSEQSPFDPAAGYDSFMRTARAIDKTFHSGFRNGFETDRGYIYLKYGQPNDIVRVETDPTAPPYEIWSYDVIEPTNQHNRRFIFYNPSLGAEDFILLHSDVNGEVNNPQWELILFRNDPGTQPNDFINGTEMGDKLGRQARRLLSDY